MGTSAYHIGVRELLQRTRTGLTVAALLLLAAIGVAVHYRQPAVTKSDPYVRFYSDDDGQTYFKDSIYRLAPFDHNGKTADIAIVCSDGNQNFVGYLERYTPQARKQLQDVYDANPAERYKTIDLMASPAISLKGMEVKMPGKDNPWIARSDMRGLNVQSPSGGEIQIVSP